MPSATSIIIERPRPQPAVERVIRETTAVSRGLSPRYAVDVVIPYFRGLQWLTATIEATLAQNRVDVTVHLVNDCSPEDDRPIRTAFRGESSLRWYRNRENIGPYLSYHQVWHELKSDFFAVQDADDLPLPNRLWRSVHALETHQAEIYGASMEQFLDRDAKDPANVEYVSGTPVHRSGVAVGGRYTPFGNLVNCTMLCRRTTVERLNGFFDCFPCGADIEFVTRAHFAGCRFYIDEAIVGLRRVHDGSISRGGRWQMKSPGRKQILEEYDRRYALYRAAGTKFDPRPFGALSKVRPELTDRIQ